MKPIAHSPHFFPHWAFTVCSRANFNIIREFKQPIIIIIIMTIIKIGKVIPLQAWCGPEGG